jgi:hypothetical protein
MSLAKLFFIILSMFSFKNSAPFSLLAYLLTISSKALSSKLISN